MSQSLGPNAHLPPPLPPGFATGPAGPMPSPAPRSMGDFSPQLEPAYEALSPAAGRSHRAPGGHISASSGLWTLAALAALAYLSVVVLRPDLVARVEESASAVAEVEALRDEVDGLRRDVAEMRSTVTETASQQKVIFERLAALGTPVNSAIPAAQSEGPPPALRLDSAPVNGPLSPRAEAAPPAAAETRAADAKVLNAKPEIETGSVKPAPAIPPLPIAKPAAAPAEPPPFSAPVVTPAAKPVGVQIASGASLDSLRLSWNLLSETHADKLKDLEPRYSLSVDNGAVVYNLMAGPVKTAADAKKMCKALAAKAIPCKVIGEFGGAAL
jgi:hypothetical protein